VILRDGRPVEYHSMQSPRTPAEEPALAERIRLLTGYAVRFGAWVTLHSPDPREDGFAEVALIVTDG
jgi:hypothetical protein